MSSKHIKLCIGLFFIISILLTGCSTVIRNPIESGKDISMFIASDIHYLADSINDRGKAFEDYCNSGDGRMLYYVDDILNAFSNDMKTDKPDILILSGDLTTNGEKQSHLSLAKKLERIEKDTGTRVFVIPGNHDIENPWARGFKEDGRYKIPSISAKDFKKIYKDFGYGEAISRDKSSLSYLAAPSKDVWLLMLDTCEYSLNKKAGSPITNGRISEKTLNWIRKCAKLAKKKHARIVTVMHHNLYIHSAVVHYGFTLDNSEEVEKVFRECNLNLVFSGHIHIQDIKYNGEGSSRIYEITTASLLMYPIQYGVLKFSPLKGFDYDTSQVNVDSWARATGSTDSNLTDFMSFSRLFVSDNTYKKAYSALLKTGLYTEAEMRDMAETMSFLNINYIRGTAGYIKDMVMTSQGYKLWMKAGEVESLGDLRAYLLSMIPHNDIDKNHLHLN